MRIATIRYGSAVYVSGQDRQSKREGSTVADVMEARWGVRATSAIARLAEPGWSYEEPVPASCPACGFSLHCLRKPYESAGRQYRYVALVCPECPAAFTLADLGFKTYAAMMRSVDLPQPARALEVTPGHHPERYVFGRDRRVCWVKLGHPADRPPDPQPGVDVRVLMPDDPAFDQVWHGLAKRGVPTRSVRYWLESEIVTSVTLNGQPSPLAASAALSTLVRAVGQRAVTRTGGAAEAARDAFDLVWQAHTGGGQVAAACAAADHVPAEWLSYLPFPELNPAQVEAAPQVAAGAGHVLVVAPTGAGKTVIGMMAALRAVLTERRKAAWLVPQRSLTDELDRELEAWRRAGIRVERLSGEYAIDAQRLRDADLWVATTEKFESICRTVSMRQALADVGCLVVDEIHLLGDPTRGPVLEALLARVRGTDSPLHIVGLSATVANAAQIAEWLGARLVRIGWRPSRLTWQLPMITASSDRAATDAARIRVATAITRMIAADDGSVLVFCGSKRGVRTTALAIAADRGADVRSVDLDDLDRVHKVCAAAGIGLHYKDWAHKREAERAFRERRLDVLVATTTVAAGVNLPARAVIMRDTKVGRRGKCGSGPADVRPGRPDRRGRDRRLGVPDRGRERTASLAGAACRRVQRDLPDHREPARSRARRDGSGPHFDTRRGRGLVGPDPGFPPGAPGRGLAAPGGSPAGTRRVHHHVRSNERGRRPHSHRPRRADSTADGLDASGTCGTYCADRGAPASRA